MTTPTLEYGTPKPASTLIGHLLSLPAAFWIVNLIYMLDAMAYFGILTLMTAYLPTVLGVGDTGAGIIVSNFTGCVTFFTLLGIGSLVEKKGVRFGLMTAVFLCLFGRVLYSVPASESPVVLAVCALLGLFVVAVGEAVIQPICYTGIKYYTNERTNSFGYGMLYGVMNLGIFLIGLLSPLIRVPIERIHEATKAGVTPPESWIGFLADDVSSGFMAVNLACTGITALALVLLFLLMTRRVEAAMIRPPDQAGETGEAAGKPKLGLTTRVWRYFAEGPFTNGRFIFFIFMLFPVQTLFAHQWLTMPLYVLRAYPQNVQDRMEMIVNWINPGIIFLGAPLCGALTRRINVYTLMIIGSAVSAVPTFLLAGGPSLSMLITYLVVFSIGEALWQPRFLEYAAELAPTGRVAQYMGLANLPWVGVKMTTGYYSGFLLGRFCPPTGPQDTGTLWLIYGLIAVLSPIGLLIGRRWVMAGWEGHQAKPTGMPVVAEGVQELKS